MNLDPLFVSTPSGSLDEKQVGLQMLIYLVFIMNQINQLLLTNLSLIKRPYGVLFKGERDYKGKEVLMGSCIMGWSENLRMTHLSHVLISTIPFNIRVTIYFYYSHIKISFLLDISPIIYMIIQIKIFSNGIRIFFSTSTLRCQQDEARARSIICSLSLSTNMLTIPVFIPHLNNSQPNHQQTF